MLGRNWQSPWSEGGQFCGSRGMSLPILGLRVRLRGAAAKTHKLSVSASFVDGTQVGPVPDGEACEAPSLSPLEAFQVMLEPLKRAQSAPAPDSPAPSAVAPKRGRAAATAAPVKSVPQAAPELPKSKKGAAKPGRKAAAVVPAMPAIPPKVAAKRTPAMTRRR